MSDKPFSLSSFPIIESPIIPPGTIYMMANTPTACKIHGTFLTDPDGFPESAQTSVDPASVAATPSTDEMLLTMRELERTFSPFSYYIEEQPRVNARITGLTEPPKHSIDVIFWLSVLVWFLAVVFDLIWFFT